MNYRHHYIALIERVRNRDLVGYSEEHHIIPKCLNGNDDEENLVKLTPEEHFVAHQLLVKIHPGVAGLVYGVRMMCFGGNRNNKWYGWLKRQYSISRVGFKHSMETKRKISESRKGVPTHTSLHTEETKRKISNSVKDSRTQEMNQSHSVKMTGRKLTEEHKNKIRESIKMKHLLKRNK